MLASRIHDLLAIFDHNINLIKKDPTSRNEKHLEIEAKFGYYSDKGFNSTVPYIHFRRLLNNLQSMPNVSPEIIEESHVAQSGNIRRVTTTNVNGGHDTVLWQRKERVNEIKNQNNTILPDIELREYDIRISANIEETVSPDQIPIVFNPTVIRDRTRHSFTILDNLFQIDLTEVMMKGRDNIMRSRYEVELEFKGTKNDLPIFEQQIEVIFKLLRGTNLVYTNTIKNNLIQDVIKILGSTRNDMIDKDVFVEARNIKRRDLVYGGIVGNENLINEKILSRPRRPDVPPEGTRYVITFKADGLRKMLIIHTSGIWLVYPPFEFNLVLNLTLNVPQLDKLLANFNGTILDGELVQPNENKLNPSLYWFLAFDCIAFRRSAGIQYRPYTERQQIVNAIAAAMKTPILTIDTKETKEIITPEDFFQLVGEFLDKRDDLEYNQDGILFIPIDVIYNPHSENYDLKNRSLTRIPDICKWKDVTDITIDFSIRWIGVNKLELYSYDNINKLLVPFNGSDINPLTSDMIEHDNPLTLNVPSDIVVEYEWVELPTVGMNNKQKGILRPRRIRYEKAGPNGLSIALDNWDDIMNPITEEDITGESLRMTFSYHNRIKRNLYDIIRKNPNYKPKSGISLFRGINILDIGSGNGGDAGISWNKLGDKNDPATGFVIAVEPNQENRTELARRVELYGLKNKVTIVPTGGEDTVAITNAVRNNIPGGKVDAVTLMLSMSFFWASDAHLDALIRTIITNLKPGGMIIFLTINGDTVEQLFEPALGGTYETDKTIGPAQIHLYSKPDIVSFGRAVDFTLPDTIVGQQREYIVHIQDFTSRLSQYGFQLNEIHRAEGEKLLSESNSLFSSLYSYGYYTNDNENALVEQTVYAPINIQLPIIPTPINSPIIEMNPIQTTPTIITNVASPLNPLIIPPVQSPIVLANTNLLPPTEPIIDTDVVLPQYSPIIDAEITPVLPRLDPTINPEIRSPLPQLTPVASPTSPRQTIIIPIPGNDVPIITEIPLNDPITQIPGMDQTNLPPIKPTKHVIEHNQLKWLAVSYTGRGGNIVRGPARNDDTDAPLTCTWYENLYRIATIGDGSCFIHAVLKAYYRPYQDNNDARYRLNMAAVVRRDLAIKLGLENPMYPGHTYWETSGRGSFPVILMQEINDEGLIEHLRVDFSLSGLQRLFNSTSQLGDEVYKYVGDAFNIDIYVLRATQNDLYPHSHTRRPEIIRNAIVIIGNTYHYEVLAINTPNGFQTVFPPGDPFLTALTNLFVGDGGFDDIFNTVPFDPDQSFIQAAVEAFLTPNGLQIPDVINEIFAETDPFKVILNRLMPRIQEAAQNRILRIARLDNPVIDRLDKILGIMDQMGFTVNERQQIRDVVHNKLDPNIPQDLETIVTTAETDGILPHDFVEAIITINNTLET